MLEKATDGISMTQAAREMGVHYQTIRNWIRSGVLPATRFGPKVVRIDPRDLEALRRQA